MLRRVPRNQIIQGIAVGHGKARYYRRVFGWIEYLYELARGLICGIGGHLGYYRCAGKQNEGYKCKFHIDLSLFRELEDFKRNSVEKSGEYYLKSLDQGLYAGIEQFGDLPVLRRIGAKTGINFE